MCSIYLYLMIWENSWTASNSHTTPAPVEQAHFFESGVVCLLGLLWHCSVFARLRNMFNLFCLVPWHGWLDEFSTNTNMKSQWQLQKDLNKINIYTKLRFSHILWRLPSIRFILFWALPGFLGFGNCAQKYRHPQVTF